jgi:hypothetical protein
MFFQQRRLQRACYNDKTSGGHTADERLLVEAGVLSIVLSFCTKAIENKRMSIGRLGASELRNRVVRPSNFSMAVDISMYLRAVSTFTWSLRILNF